MLRKSTIFISCLLTVGCLALLLVVWGRTLRVANDQVTACCRSQVRRLQLTDLALFTEARYTRNPSLADRFTPFQDHPFALEHFPSGSLVSPPESLK